MATFEELLLEVDGSNSAAVASTELAGLDLKERDHLQEWVLRHPQVLGDGVRVITCEYDGWQAAGGELVRDRLDVLGLSPDGRPVVAELKRGMAPHSIHMQAINYAAMVSRLSTRDLAELYAQFEERHGVLVNVDDVLTRFQTDYLLNEESIRNPRLALIAADFPASVTASVVWLNERAVDVWLVRYRAYRLSSGQVIVSFSRLFPVPTAEEFTVGRLRAPDASASANTPLVPWDEASLKRLAARANAATLAHLARCVVNPAIATNRCRGWSIYNGYESANMGHTRRWRKRRENHPGANEQRLQRVLLGAPGDLRCGSARCLG